MLSVAAISLKIANVFSETSLELYFAITLIGLSSVAALAFFDNLSPPKKLLYRD